LREKVVALVEERVQQSCHGLPTGGGDSDPTPTHDFSGFYAETRDSTACVLLTTANAALPPVCATRVHLYDILPPAVVEELKRDGVRLVGPADPVDAGLRPAMGVAPGEYQGIILKAVERGVCELVKTRPSSIQGLFGVLKDVDWARVILDCRPANLLCRLPPNPDLPFIEILSKLSVEEGEKLRAAILDLANYYHSIIMPEEWRDLFGLPAVEIEGETYWPRWVTLPMGWSFSVYLAQLAHVYQLSLNSPTFRTALRLRGPLVPRRLPTGAVATEPYIDDLPSLSTSISGSNRGLRDMLRAEVVDAKKEKVKFAVRGKSTRVWGVDVDARGCVRPPPDKLRTLVAVTRAAVTVRWISPRGLQRLVGKWLWFALLHRALLSCFGPLFRQSRSRRHRFRLWPSSQRALSDLVALSPLLVVDPGRPVGQLCATDASDRGGGVVIDSSLSTDAFWQLAPYVYYKGRPDLNTTTYHEGLGALLQPHRFPTQFLWRWQDPTEHIGVKEARAAFSGVRRVVLRSGAVLRRRHMFLVDNQGVVCAFSRGRSRNAKVNFLIQRTAAVLLATASSIDLIWVPTRFQPADRASRA
jgi:hypothetical protein